MGLILDIHISRTGKRPRVFLAGTRLHQVLWNYNPLVYMLLSSFLVLKFTSRIPVRRYRAGDLQDELSSSVSRSLCYPVLLCFVRRFLTISLSFVVPSFCVVQRGHSSTLIVASYGLGC